MDPSLLCETQLGDTETEEDIMLLESEESESQETSKSNKRPHTGNGDKFTPPPSKKMRESDTSKKLKPSPHSPSPILQKQVMSANGKSNLAQKAQLQRVGTLPGGHVTFTQTARVTAPARNTPGNISGTFRPRSQMTSGSSIRGRPSPRSGGRPQASPQQDQQKKLGSVTWSYTVLQENAYTADIKKSSFLKDYEPEKCECKQVPEGQTGCRDGCHNRAIYVECDVEICNNRERCGNRNIQLRAYAPGLERFMTTNKGWGVRARQAVASGTFILEYTGEIVSQKEFEKRMLSRYTEDEHHYCLALDSKHMIDAHRAGSECRFVNHSCDPNCEMMKWNVKGLYRMALFAKKDILAGQEICYDYNFSLFDSDKGQKCYCEAAECRGVIGGKHKDFMITIDGKGGHKTTQSTATDPTMQLNVDEKWFKQHVQSDELTWFRQHAPKPQQLTGKLVKCTVCNDQLNHAHLGQIQRHPALGVIMCNNCRKKYNKVSWDKSEDGNDDLCRWCTEGGNIFLCDYCPSAFCQKCIKWNLGRKFVKEINDSEKWKCLLCDPSPLKTQRSVYWAVHQYHKRRQSDKTKNPTPVKSTPNKAGKKAIPAQHHCNSTPVRPVVNGRSPCQTRFLPKSPAINARASPMPVGGSPVDAMARMKNNPSLSIRPAVATGNHHRPTINNGGVNKQHSMIMINGIREPRTPTHWLDKMLKEVEDTADHVKHLVKELRHGWIRSQKGEGDETENTRKLRRVLQIHQKNIDDIDKNLIDEYRTNVPDADLRDVDPKELDNIKNNERIKREQEIFSKSSLENDKIDGVVCTPDMPILLEMSDDDEEVENVESTPDIVALDEGSSDNDSEEVMCVDPSEDSNDASAIISDNEPAKEGSVTDAESVPESETEGEVKMIEVRKESILDESIEELSEVEGGESDNTEHIDNKNMLSLESDSMREGIDQKENENKSSTEFGCNAEIADEGQQNKSDDSGNNEECIKTEVDSKDKVKIVPLSAFWQNIKAETDLEKGQTEAQCDSEKVKTEAQSDSDKIKTEPQFDSEEKVKTETESDSEENGKMEVESDSKDKLKIEVHYDSNCKEIIKQENIKKSGITEVDFDGKDETKIETISNSNLYCKVKNVESVTDCVDNSDNEKSEQIIEKNVPKSEYALPNCISDSESLDLKIKIEIEETHVENEECKSTNSNEVCKSLSKNETSCTVNEKVVSNGDIGDYLTAHDAEQIDTDNKIISGNPDDEKAESSETLNRDSGVHSECPEENSSTSRLDGTNCQDVSNHNNTNEETKGIDIEKSYVPA